MLVIVFILFPTNGLEEVTYYIVIFNYFATRTYRRKSLACNKSIEVNLMILTTYNLDRVAWSSIDEKGTRNAIARPVLYDLIIKIYMGFGLWGRTMLGRALLGLPNFAQPGNEWPVIVRHNNMNSIESNVHRLFIFPSCQMS